MEATYHAQSQNHTTPEQDIIEQRSTPDPPASLNHDNGHLQHHCNKAIATELSSDATHDKLVGQAGYEEGDDGGHRSGHGVQGSAIDMASEEVVDWNVPLTTELKPVRTVPPV